MNLDEEKRDLRGLITEAFKLLVWFIGSICFIMGLSAFVDGNVGLAVEDMGLGLVFIAIGSKDLRNKLTNFFYTFFKSLWKIVTRS